MTKFRHFLLFTILSLLSFASLSAQVITGTVVDKQTNEPLIGVAVVVQGTTMGTSTDIDGSYTLNNVASGSVLSLSYISYNTIISEPLPLEKGQGYKIDFMMESDDLAIESVRVTARRNLESQTVLQSERIKASYAIENLGAKEMSLKGLSNVAEGVKKITGISTAGAGQIFVRGLGDRYSITTLNGLPIASPNPDNKLIPLDLFPSSVVKNITVSKVYNASSFADYSGARIDIGTKENVSDDFLTISLKTGGTFGTLFNDFYRSDNAGYFSSNSISSSVKEIDGTLAFREYIQNNNIFDTSFEVSKITAMPDFGGTISGGKSWNITNTNKLSMLASFSAAKESSAEYDSYYSLLNAQGVANSEYTFDTYSTQFNMSGLLSLGYNYGDSNGVNYTMFYARDYIDEYKYRDGYFADDRDTHLIGSNSVTRIYTLLYNQLAGHQSLSNRLNLSWAAAYGSTGSDEPDRRQVTFLQDDQTGEITLFSLNSQETMRYFSELDEQEIVGDLKLSYSFGEKNTLTIGGAYKNKDRDYSSVSFYYNISNVSNTSISDIYSIDGLYSYDNISNGTITVSKDYGGSTVYDAGTDVYAAFAETDIYVDNLLINLGLRYENYTSFVNYFDYDYNRSELNSIDLFPTVNLKYNLTDEHALRLGASRTVTRPSFIEMAPFLYQESLGGEQVKGNEDLTNGYNYNLDLRYEFFKDRSSDMISVTGYYKYLETPIERVQRSTSGDNVLSTFENTEDGMAAGFEFELRKQFLSNLNFNFNFSYMYTNIVLSEDSGYTDTNRMLQGASPYLMNADLSYVKNFESGSSFTAALLYNLRGPRIHSVGCDGLNNVVESSYSMLNFSCAYNFTNHWSVSASLSNLLDSTNEYTQEIDGKDVVVQHYKSGISAGLGLSYSF